MFDRLATSLNIAFKWFPMFDLDQTFSSNILLHEQMFDRLAASANKASPRGKKQPIRNRIYVTSLHFAHVINQSRHNFSGLSHKASCGLILLDV